MKALLGFSLIGNVILGYLYFRETQKPPLERIVVEMKASPPRLRTVTKEVIVEKNVPAAAATPLTEKEFEATAERVARDKEEFLTGAMGFTPEKLRELEQIKLQYSKKFQAVLSGQTTDLSLEQRRQLLEIEAQRDGAFVRVMGKSKWEKFQKFKTKYNLEHRDFGVVVPLDL